MKKPLLLAVLLLSSVGAIAQLFVQPNSGTDSYVYVSDQVLFVEQDIEMSANPSADFKSSIYLRDGAQLIQGITSSDNSGNGKLSVYQNAPDSDQWTYNYWCSPVSITPAAAGNQNFGISRIYQIDGLTEATQNIPTVSFNGFSTPSLQISKRWIYTKPRGLEAENDYQYVGATNSVPAGMGFTMKGVDGTPVPITGYNYDFRGRPNNGTINVSIWNNELTLTGNPYPSALDLNRMFYDTETGEADGTMNGGNVEILEFRFWDEDKTMDSHLYLENAGGYGTWIPGTSNPDGDTGDIGFQPGTYTPPTFTIWDAQGNSTGMGAAGAMYDRRFSPIGQGFLVSGASTGVIKLKNKYRRYKLEGDNSEFRFRADDPVSKSNGLVGPIKEADNRIPSLRVNTEFSTSHIRQTVLVFSENSTDGFDRGQDGRSPMDATSEMYFPVGLEQLKVPCVISSFPFGREKQIPVTFILDMQHQLVVKIIEEIKFGANEAYLWDSVEHTFQQISNNNEATFTLPAGTYEDRFFVVFKTFRDLLQESPGQTMKEELLSSIDVFQNNPVKQLEIGNPEGYEIESANIFDMSGKLVLSESNLGNSNKLTFPTDNLSEGLYLVMLTTNQGITIDYKITVQN